MADRRQIGEPLAGHLDAITTVAYSPDGKTIASGGDDNMVILWMWLGGDRSANRW